MTDEQKNREAITDGTLDDAELEKVGGGASHSASKMTCARCETVQESAWDIRVGPDGKRYCKSCYMKKFYRQ